MTQQYGSLSIWSYLALLLICSCSEYQQLGYDNNYLNVTQYEIYKPNLYTAGGIPIYSNSEIDLELIDIIIEDIEDCLNIPLNRELFMVYIPDDWYISSCSEEQLFPCTIVEANKPYLNGRNICEVTKGLKVTEECPCHCRATIQDENIIVTAPNLKIFPQELVRMITGENNPYIEEWTRICIKTPNLFL
jgi:hypothetical protein